MRRTRWVLLAAFALSLLVHAVVTIFVRPWSAQREAEPAVAMRRVRIVHLRIPPRARPLPHPLHRRAPIVPPRIPQVAKRASPAPAVRGRQVSAARAAPPPKATPCAAGDAPASIVAEPSPPPIAPGTRALDVSGVAAVTVQLDREGIVTGAAIAQSTGHPAFDALAISMAKDARYEPALHACRAVASTYLFRVQFYAW